MMNQEEMNIFNIYSLLGIKKIRHFRTRFSIKTKNCWPLNETQHSQSNSYTKITIILIIERVCLQNATQCFICV